MHPHLLSVDDLSRDDIERILGRAESFAEVSGREIKKVPTLRGRTVINLFYEASTRTQSSFELAAKRLSADLITLKATGSAVEKGESLKDTVQTLSAYDPAAIVIRSPHAGAAGLVARWTQAAVINAGDGKHEHPTQALLDLYTLKRRGGRARGPERLDRRRRAPQPGGALEHPRLHAHGLRGHGLRAADADPARDRGARLPGAPHARRAALGRRGLRPAHAARAHDGLASCRRCASTPRSTRSTAAGWARPAADAPRAREPRRRARGRGDRLAPGADHRAGRVRSGGADGGALRAARRGAGRHPACARAPRRSPSPHERQRRADERVRTADRDRARLRAPPRRPPCSCAAPGCSTRARGSTSWATCSSATAGSRRSGERLSAPDGAEVVDAEGLHAFPAFVDPHVHLRTPGREDEEDIDSGTRAAAAGGFCVILAQPNTEPVVDSAPVLRSLRERARARGPHPDRLHGRDHRRAARRAAHRDGRARRRGRRRLHRRRPARALAPG